MVKNVYAFEAKDILGREVSLAEYKGQVILIVNVASECGFTSQYSGLETLYNKYKDQGLVVLGFPCNQFGAQEPADEDGIRKFCEMRFGVTFPLFSKVEVKGSNAHPLFDFLCKSLPGLMGTTSIKWNFTKFLVDRDGIPSQRFGSKDSPEKIEPAIKKLIDSKES